MKTVHCAITMGSFNSKSMKCITNYFIRLFLNKILVGCTRLSKDPNRDLIAIYRGHTSKYLQNEKFEKCNNSSLFPVENCKIE
uniref:Putative ovule protein n=1 Tax=Solanum chacoense TaxID=4108 RepID=A0A0V0H4F0_SOLCH